MVERWIHWAFGSTSVVKMEHIHESQTFGAPEKPDGLTKHPDLLCIYGVADWIDHLLRFYQLERGLSQLGFHRFPELHTGTS